jgi:hypothetical protein
MLPLTVHGNTKVVVAPRELTVRGLLDAIERTPDIKPRIRITSDARLQKFIADRAGDALGQMAAESLRAKRPELSAGTGQRRSIVTAAAVAGIAVFALTAPGIAGLAMETILGLIFLAWTLLRLLGILSLRSVRRATQPIPDNQLPVYSIVVALYREAAAAGDLVAALRKLNYPPERLDIKLVLEPDDHETQAALTALKLTAPFEVIIAPAAGPKTKPKALNAALPFARKILGGLRRRGPSGTRSASSCARRLRCRRRAPCVCSGQIDDRQHLGQLAHARLHRRIRGAVRCIPARPRSVALAAAARRLVQSLPHLGAAQKRRVGPVQRDGRRGPWHADRANGPSN